MLFAKLWWHPKDGWGHESGGQTQARDDQEGRGFRLSLRNAPRQRLLPPGGQVGFLNLPFTTRS
jgi:hypothetical protein